MKTAAFVAIALSGLALAAPSFKRAGSEWKDLTTLKYANSVPIAVSKNAEHDKRAASAVPVKDNRNLHYSHDLPIAKAPATSA